VSGQSASLEVSRLRLDDPYKHTKWHESNELDHLLGAHHGVDVRL